MVNLYNYHVFGFTLSRENVLKWFWVNLPLNIPVKINFPAAAMITSWWFPQQIHDSQWFGTHIIHDHASFSIMTTWICWKWSLWACLVLLCSQSHHFGSCKSASLFLLPGQIFLKNWISFSMHVEDDPVFRFGHWVFTKSIYWRPPKMGFLIKYL